MGIAATFRLLETLPPDRQAAMAEAALREPYPELQAAAFDALAGPGRLDRPDLVFQRFPDLLPEVRAKVLERREVFSSLAREQVRRGSDRDRRIGHEMLAAILQVDAMPSLIQGLRDPSPQVRDRCADLLETLALRYYYHVTRYRSQGDAASRRYIEENRAVLRQSLEDALRAWPDHGRRIFLDLAVESGPEVYPVVTQVILGRPGSALREAFIRTLSVAATEPAVDLLLRLLQESDPLLRNAAVEACRARRDPEFARRVASALSRMPADRLGTLAARCRELPWWEAVEAADGLDAASCLQLLEFLSRSSLPPADRNARLLRFLERPHPEVRARALLSLRVLGAPEALDAALRALEDPSDEVKVQAAATVAAVDPPDKLRILAPFLNSGHEELRRIASSEILPVSFSRYLESFDRLDPATRTLAARALAKLDAKMVERLAEEVSSLDPDRRLKALRIVQLVDAEEDLRPVLMELLADPDRRIRATTIKIVHLSRSAEGVNLLAQALRDPDPRVRANAVEAFEDLGDPRLGGLLEPFLEDPESRIRANAAKALLALGRPDARSILESMLSGDDEDRRISAAWAIGEARYGGAEEVLRRRMERESSPRVRGKIEETLSRMRETA